MSEHVLSGPATYIDYDRPWGSRRQWLVSNTASNILTSFLAVYLTLAAKSLFNIAKRILLVMLPKTNTHAEVRRVAQLSHSAEGMSVRSFLSFCAGVIPGFYNIGKTMHASRFRFLKPKFWSDVWDIFRSSSRESAELPWMLILAIGMAGLFIGTVLMGIFSALVVSNSVALSTHPGCAILRSNGSMENPSYARMQKYFHDIEKESGYYSRRCYNLRESADGCDFFYEQSIQFDITLNTTCPFSGDLGPLCYGGPSSAITFKTGMVKPETIGINTPLKYTFERETTCSPLRMDDTFIRPFVDEKDALWFRYFYGNRSGNSACSQGFSNCTFELQEGIPLAHPTYSVFTTQTHPIIEGVWQPLWEVNDTAGETSTLILISNLGIAYPERRDDPIFPAETTYDNMFYYNTRWSAAALGCIDRTNICSPDGTLCGSLKYWGGLEKSDSKASLVQSMLYFSLLFSDIGSAISFRRAEALDATARLVGGASSLLSTEQWKVEAQQLFETSLARIQINARNIARGPQSGHSQDLVDIMHPNDKGMCYMYKFNSTGWSNISMSGFLGALGAGLVVFIIGIPKENEELWIEEPLRNWMGPFMIHVQEIIALRVEARQWLQTVCEPLSKISASFVCLAGQAWKLGKRPCPREFQRENNGLSAGDIELQEFNHPTEGDAALEPQQ